MNEIDAISQPLLEALARQDRAGLAREFDKYPNPNLENAKFFLQAAQDVYDVAAIDCMATSFVHAGNATPGLAYAGTAVLWARQLWKTGQLPVNNDLLWYLGNDTYLQMKVLFDLGRYSTAISLYESWEKDGMPQWRAAEYIGTHLQAAENYLEHKAIEKAGAMVDEINPAAVPPASKVLYDRLKYKINLLTTPTSKTPGEIARFKQQQTLADLESMLQLLKAVMKGDEENWDLQAVESLVAAHKTMEVVPDSLVIELSNKISAAVMATQEKMGGKSNEVSLQQKRHRLGILMAPLSNDDQPLDGPALELLLIQMQELKEWFSNGGHASDVAFLCWVLYTCYNRLEQYAEASDQLEQLYYYLEGQRASIIDIEKRAGVFGQYPHLFGAMAFTNYQSGNVKRLFSRIEASKGRSLADRMLVTSGLETNEYESDLQVLLVPLLHANNAHYLTLFCDDDRTYSVLLTRQGKLFATANGPSRQILESWLRKDYPSPQTWRSAPAGFFAKKRNINIPAELGVLLRPVHLAMEEGWVKGDEHLVFSPDGVLNLFSLQYAIFLDGEPLIKTLSVSKIHSGSQLAGLLQQPEFSPAAYHHLCCNAKEDDAEKQAAFSKLGEWMNEAVGGVKFSPQIENIEKLWKPQCVHHLATHGVFPLAGSHQDPVLQNPFYHSGLLMMANNNLPELDAGAYYFQSPHLLCPQMLVQSKARLQNSHVSMHACVSGRSLEGYGGDALGMEWALFYKGVTSVISANWNIDVHWSNKLFLAFYKGWLQNGMSKAAAHRKALLDVKQEVTVEILPAEYYWAGLSLTGDFR